MSRIIVGAVRRPVTVISIVIALSAFFALGLRRGVRLEVSPLEFVERGTEARADFESARKKFGSDDYLVVAVVGDDIFASQSLTRLKTLHDEISNTKGVAEVLSLVNAPYARSVDGVVSNINLFSSASAGGLENGGSENGETRGDIGRQVLNSPTQISKLRSGVARMKVEDFRLLATGDKLYAGNLISPDSRTAALNILFKSDLPTATRHMITARIYNLARASGFDQVYFAGDPFSQWRGTEAIKSDLRLFLPLTLLFIAILLWLCFRSFIAVTTPLLTIGIGLIWLMGLMAWFDAHFTTLTLMLPTLMLAIGCSYMVHVINQIGICNHQSRNANRGFRDEPISSPAINDNPHSAIEEALRFISLPVIVSALTIIAGFLSLVFTAIPAVRVTAIFAAIGAAFTMLLSLTFVPAVLVLVGENSIRFRVGLNGGMAKLLEGVGRWATLNQTRLYILTAIIIIVSVAGVFRIVIDIDYFHFLKPNSETSVGLAEVGKRLSGAVNFDIIVEGKNAGAIEKPDVVRRIAELQAFAETRKNSSRQGIDRSLSVADFIKHVNRAFHDNDPQYYDIPSDESVIGELLSDRDQLKGFLDSDGRVARILIRSNLSASREMAGTIREIEKRGRELLPEFRVFATGTFVLLNRTSDQIAREQLRSVTIALVTIYLMLTLLFGSLRVGFTALVPNLIPILFFFGFMGWRGIELNLTTSLVASVVLGLAVDNAVQFIVRFRRAQAATPELRNAILESMRLSGRPIIYANIALAATFVIFFFSEFKPIASFGILSAVTIIGCLIEDLVLLPARLTSPVFRAK